MQGRELGHVGTSKAVPVLAALLGEDKLSHMARYGLEPIPDPAVDEVLRSALGKLEGRLLAGVVGSIGVRRDAKAVPALIGLLDTDHADVCTAAARSLARIATPEAVDAVSGKLAKAPANLRRAVADYAPDDEQNAEQLELLAGQLAVAVTNTEAKLDKALAKLAKVRAALADAGGDD